MEANLDFDERSIYCSSRISSKTHIYKLPCVLPCRTIACSRCVDNYVELFQDEDRALIQCPNTKCTENLHVFDNLFDCPLDEAFPQYLSENVNKIGQFLVNKLKSCVEKERIDLKGLHNVVQNWIDNSECEIEIRIESIKIQIDSISEKMIDDVNRIEEMLNPCHLLSIKEKRIKKYKKYEKLAYLLSSSHAGVPSMLLPIKVIESAFVGCIHKYKPTHDLVHAIKYGDLDALDYYLNEEKQDVNQPIDEYKTFMLHLATSYGNMDVIKLLLKHNADIEVEANLRERPLMIASSKSHLDVIELLIKNHANVNCKNITGKTALIAAARSTLKNAAECVDFLLKNGADVYAKDNIGYSALNYAIKRRKKDVLEVILNHDPKQVHTEDGLEVLKEAFVLSNQEIIDVFFQHKANVNKRNRDGETILNYVTSMVSKKEVVLNIIRHNADVNVSNSHGWTPLMHASNKYSREAIVEILLQNNANVNAANKNGDTALIIASSKADSFKTVQALIKANAEVNLKNKQGSTALFKATEGRCFKTVDILLEHKADINIADYNGNNLLMIAAIYNNKYVLDIMLKINVDIDARNKLKETALFLASESGNEEIVTVLLENHADINAKNKHGGTPLLKAAENGYSNVVRNLLKYGADRNAQNNYKWNAMRIAMKNHHDRVIKELQEN